MWIFSTGAAPHKVNVVLQDSAFRSGVQLLLSPGCNSQGSRCNDNLCLALAHVDGVAQTYPGPLGSLQPHPHLLPPAFAAACPSPGKWAQGEGWTPKVQYWVGGWMVTLRIQAGDQNLGNPGIQEDSGKMSFCKSKSDLNYRSTPRLAPQHCKDKTQPRKMS